MGSRSNAVSAVSEERTKQLTEFQEERKRLQQETAEDRIRILKQAEGENAKARAEITAEREAIALEWEKLEVSSHKDARRQQFKKLQEDLQNTLNQPVADIGLRQTRWAVFAALVFAGFAAGFFAYLSISTQPSNAATTASWVFPAIRSLVLTFASLGAFLGAAAWLRYFYIRDLQAQEEIRRFRNDMARASWVMDATLEIKKEHGEEIPQEWITGATEGLFSSRNSHGQLEQGAQALAALMGLTASATFGPDGPSVVLSKKGSKAISEAAKAET